MGETGGADSLQKLLAEGRADEAANLGESLLQASPDDAKLNMLYGVALGQVGRIDEATSSARRATMLAPTDPEAFHNLAVLLYDQGDHIEAASIAKEALRLDPGHEGAMETLKKCEAKEGSVPFESNGTQIAPTKESIRPGPENAPTHVLKLGEPWTYIGYGLLVVCFASSMLTLLHPFVDPTKGLHHDSLSIFAFFAYALTGFASVFWLLVDLIDRRRKFVWLLPVWICGFAALPGLPLALYLFVGRKAL